MSRIRTGITLTTTSFAPTGIRVADKIFEPQAGGKMLGIKYNHNGETFDIPRIQTSQLTVGNVWDNLDATKTNVVSYTVALNMDRLYASDMESDVPADEEVTKSKQRKLVGVLESFDREVIDKITEIGALKVKGKNLTAEEVESKFNQTVHWPDDAKYSLGIRTKINVADTLYSGARKIFICDQNDRDITYWKMGDDNQRVYAYESTFASMAGEPQFNIDALRNRGTVIQRAVLESNNAWIQQSISVSWKLINIKVDVAPSISYGSGAWASDEAAVGASEPAVKKSRPDTNGLSDSDINELMND